MFHSTQAHPTGIMTTCRTTAVCSLASLAGVRFSSFALILLEQTNQMEERTSSAGSYWSGSVRDISVHPGPEGREIAEKTGKEGNL